MRPPAPLIVRTLAAVSLLAFVLREIAAQRKFLEADPQIAALLMWRSYGATISGSSLYVLGVVSTFGVPVGLVGMLLYKRWGWWFLLVGYSASWVASIFGGVTIGLPLPRSLGVLSAALGIAALVTFWLAHLSQNERKEQGGL